MHAQTGGQIAIKQAEEQKTDSPRVLFVIPGGPHGNSMVFARRQALSLRRLQVDVKIFYLSSRTEPWRVAAEFVRFRRVLKECCPDVIHAHFGTITAFFAALAAPAHPLVITFRGGDLNPAPALAPWPSKIRSVVGQAFSQLAALRASHVVCVSPQLRHRLWWRQQRASIFPSGVDLNLFSPRSPAEARRQLGWDERDRVILFNAAGPWWVKRPDLAHDAWLAARKVMPDLRMEILDGSVDPERIPLLMNAANCLLLTSDTEGSPTVVQEALVCGLPVVSVEVGDVNELLRGVETARVVPRHAQALANALIELVQNGKRGDIETKMDKFSDVTIARELKDVYLRIQQHETSGRGMKRDRE